MTDQKIRTISVRPTFKYSRIFFELLFRYFYSTLFIVFICLLVSWNIGAGYGVRYLLSDSPDWDTRGDSPFWWLLQSRDFLASFGLTLTAIAISWAVLNREIIERPQGRLANIVKGKFKVKGKFGIIFAAHATILYGIFFLFWWSNWHDWSIGKSEIWQYRTIFVGILFGALLFLLTRTIVRICVEFWSLDLVQNSKNEKRYGIIRFYSLSLLPLFAILFVISLDVNLVPALSIFLVTLFIYIFTQTFNFSVNLLRWSLAFSQFAALAVLVLWFNVAAHDDQKLFFDGIETAGAASPDQSSQPRANHGRVGPEGPVKFTDTLVKWKELTGQDKPKLVVVATSGGAYRAAFWTALFLDKVASESANRDLRGFDRSIRLITGASGGMVGAAYFAALAPDDPTKSWPSATTQLSEDITDSQRTPSDKSLYQTSYPVSGDSLSAIVHQLVTIDLPSIFWPGRVELDRGKALESQWKTLAKSFSDMRAGEEQGWRPPLVFSPTLLETGQPLLISNLDVEGIGWAGRKETAGKKEMEVLFDSYPGSQRKLTLATAARMQASFPYVSPAVNLPPPLNHKVVDAGYYDNYGVSLASAFLAEKETREWVRDNTSGVLLVQLRAFPLGLPGEEDCEPDKKARDAHLPVEWLTNPIVGALASRGGSMAFRSQQELRMVQDIYERMGIELKTVVFVDGGEGTLSWYMPDHELKRMRTCFYQEWNRNESKLTSFWQSEPPRSRPAKVTGFPPEPGP